METETLWCFQCGSEYTADVAECVECGVGLVAEPPLSPDDVGTDEDEQLAYEFHDWSFESRRMLDQLLTGHGIVHSWQGATMIVRLADESAVDELVDEVEVAALPTLDAELEHTVYEMAGWSAEAQTELTSRLGARGIAHEFDVNGDLVVHAEDESLVDAILDDIEDRALNGGGDGDGTEAEDLDGVDVNELLSTLYGAADRLRKNARDSQGVLGFLDNVPTVERIRTPFGFDRPAWITVVESAAALRDLLESDESEDDDVRAQAQQVRDLLFGLI